MSGPTLEEKLATTHSTGGRARASRSQLEKRSGFRDFGAFVLVDVMESQSRWRLIGGRGPDATYELEGGE